MRELCDGMRIFDDLSSKVIRLHLWKISQNTPSYPRLHWSKLHHRLECWPSGYLFLHLDKLPKLIPLGPNRPPRDDTITDIRVTNNQRPTIGIIEAAHVATLTAEHRQKNSFAFVVLSTESKGGCLWGQMAFSYLSIISLMSEDVDISRPNSEFQLQTVIPPHPRHP
jgi:hypothetical protein